MTEREVTLMEVLDNREARVARQNRLLSQWGRPLISFTMNIPGPVKNNDLIRAGFSLGCRMLTDLLTSARIPLLHREEVSAVTGCEGFFVVDAVAGAVKALCAELEDGSPLGRLFDLDVLSPDGEKLSRDELGAPPRKCLICDRPSRVCGPVRAHSAAELQQRAFSILTGAVFSHRAEEIGAMAVKSLLYEVSVTPKPGLVDRANSGAHTDMDFYTFLSSASALQPYFTQCARIGMETRDAAPEETFARLRLPGRLAEQTMLRATGGVNTHKGAIFSIGLACAAAGRLLFTEFPAPEEVLSLCAAMTRGITARELAGITDQTARTAGERLYAAHGITGIRGQAEAGFPAVLTCGLPVLRQGLAQGLSTDRAGAAALLALLTAADDTNLITRGSRAVQLELQRRISALLSDTPYPREEVLSALDEQFISRHLSPGGSADLLALCFFLLFLAGNQKNR